MDGWDREQWLGILKAQLASALGIKKICLHSSLDLEVFVRLSEKNDSPKLDQTLPTPKSDRTLCVKRC